MPPNKDEERSATWTAEEIKLLLTVRAEAQIDSMMCGTSRDSAIYERISSRLMEVGTIRRNKKQVRTKLKNIKAQYMRYKDQQRTSGEKKVFFPYLDLCEEIWGCTASANPVNIVSSAPSGSGVNASGSGSGTDTGTGTNRDPNPEKDDGDIVTVRDDAKEMPAGVDQDSDDDDGDVQYHHGETEDNEDNIGKEAAEVQPPQENDADAAHNLPSTSNSDHHHSHDGPKKKKAKTNKLETSLKALSGSLFGHLESSQRKYDEDENRRTERQQTWDLEMQTRHEESQRQLIDQMNAGQMAAVRMFTGMLHMFSGQQHHSQSQPPLWPFTDVHRGPSVEQYAPATQHPQFVHAAFPQGPRQQHQPAPSTLGTSFPHFTDRYPYAPPYLAEPTSSQTFNKDQQLPHQSNHQMPAAQSCSPQSSRHPDQWLNTDSTSDKRTSHSSLPEVPSRQSQEMDAAESSEEEFIEL